MSTFAVRYSQPLLGSESPGGALVGVTSATVTVRRNGAAATIYSNRAKANPVTTGVVTTGVASGAVGLDTTGNLVFWTEPGDGIDVQVTVGGVTTTVAVPTLSPDPAEPVAIPAGTYAELAQANVFTAAQRVNGAFGVNAAGTNRIPINLGSVINATTATSGTSDKVGIVETVTITGDFTGTTGSNATTVFPLNVFAVTGPAANDGKGLTDIYNIIETDIQTPAGTTFTGAVRGLLVQAAFFGATAGATVSQMESLRVAAPARKDGATAGTATTVYGLYVEAVAAASVGATGAFSLFVDGGVSRFAGRLDVAGSIANTTGNLELFADFSRAAGATLALDANSTGAATGHATVFLSKTGSAFRVSDGTATVFSVSRTGVVTTSEGAVTATVLPPHSLDPRLNTQPVGGTAANRRTFMRVTGAPLTISKLAIIVGTASGNIEVSVYANTGTGGAARPTGTPLASSGSVACPAAGEAVVALTGSLAVTPGMWFAIWADNATATFGRAPATAMASSMAFVTQHSTTTAGAAPASLASAGNSFFMVGVE